MQSRVLRFGVILLVVAAVAVVVLLVLRGSGTGPRQTTTVEDASSQVVQERDDPQVPAPAGTGSLSGRVINTEAAGVEGALVSLAVGLAVLQLSLPGWCRPTGRETKTDSDGVYRFEDLPAASNYVLLVSHESYARAHVPGPTVYDNDCTLVSDIVLHRGSRVLGVVKDGRGGLVIRATIELWDLRETSFMKEGEKRPWKVTQTDESGRYEFTNVHFNACEVVASAPGYAVSSKTSTMVFAESGDREVDLTLGQPVEIAGKVEDERGAGIEGALVKAVEIGQARDVGIPRARTETAQDGAFTLTGLAQGKCTIKARAHGFSDREAGPVEAGARDVHIVLEPRGTVAGDVVDAASGKPLKEYRLHLHCSRPDIKPTPTGKLKYVSAADGAYEFDDVDPGSYVMEAEAEGYAPCRSEPFQVLRGETTRNVRIVMSLGGAIEGRVVTSDGRPVPGALVQLNANGFVLNPVMAIFSSSPSSIPPRKFRARTDEKGDFALRLVIPGTYQIEVTSHSFSPRLVNDVGAIEGQTTAVGRIVLSAGGSISGNCYDASGRPFAGGRVQAVAQTGFCITMWPDHDGRFEIQNLPPGEYEVTLLPEKVDGVQVDPLVMIVQAQESMLRVQVTEGRTERVDLRVPPPETAGK